MKQCSTPNCSRQVMPPKRKCMKCLSLKGFSKTTLKPSTRGKNARGTCLHKPDKIRTKRAKKQNTYMRGRQPRLRTSAGYSEEI